MSEYNKNHPEAGSSSAEAIFARIAKHEPKPIAAFTPGNIEEGRQLFLSGNERIPSYVYPKLEGLNPIEDLVAISAERNLLSKSLDENSVEYIACSQYADRYMLVHEMIAAAQELHSEDTEKVESAKSAFMELNEQLYGTPDEATYRSLLQEVAEIRSTPETEHVKDELLALLPELGENSRERFKPSDETVKKMGEIAEYMYGGMLAHVPVEQEEFNAQEIADIFQEIITDEFGEAAKDWTVKLSPNAAISVAASEKTVKVPENRKPVTNEALRGLVAHELGVHMLRALNGAETNLPILATGLSDYYDSEEGLGMVMEQAVKGEYQEAGVAHYIIAGLMHFDQKDYRDTYEIMSRVKYLQAVDSGEPADATTREESQIAAEKSVLRIARGTNSLPWFKDLAYYNGAMKMWQRFEETSGDFESFMLTFLGKADPSIPEHQRIILETKSR